MKYCRVVNRSKDPFDVYIGRGSKWGNPYTHKSGTKAQFVLNNREESIAAYREYITNGEGQHLLDSLMELEGKVLGCYCKPKECHGDVLVELVNQKLIKKLLG